VRSFRTTAGFALAVVAGALPVSGREPGGRGGATEPLAVVVYLGRLGNDWADAGWAPRTHSYGPARIDFSNNGGWMLEHVGPLPALGGLLFRIKAPPEFGDFLEVRLDSAEPVKFPSVRPGAAHRKDLGDGWAQVWIPMAELSPGGDPFDVIVLRAAQAVSSAPVLIDHVWLLRSRPPTPPRPR